MEQDFFYDKAPALDDNIEHHMPDYNLYKDWVNKKLNEVNSKTGKPKYKRDDFKYYLDYSIGFMTRGCFRKCDFCVNKNYSKVNRHSPLSEFLDERRPKICLLDDNVLGCKDWKEIFRSLQSTRKSFQFKQGLDERILTEEKCEMLFDANYDGDYTFAFDNISDYDLINRKLQLIRKYTSATNIKFYVLVGFEGTDATDIENMWKRVALLMEYRCLPYIMRYQNKNDTPWKESKYKGIYITMARWCNQPSFFKKMSFREYCLANQERHKTKGTLCAAMRALTLFETEHPEIAKKYFDLKFK